MTSLEELTERFEGSRAQLREAVSEPAETLARELETAPFHLRMWAQEPDSEALAERGRAAWTALEEAHTAFENSLRAAKAAHTRRMES